MQRKNSPPPTIDDQHSQMSRRTALCQMAKVTAGAMLVGSSSQVLADPIPPTAPATRTGKMRAAVMTACRQPIQVTEVPLPPPPGPEDVIIRIEASGVCRSDWHMWNNDFTWFKEPIAAPRLPVAELPWLTVPRMKERGPVLPYIPGHEIGGVVEEAGIAVKCIKIGDRVTIPFHQSCGCCPECRKGNTNICDNGRNYPNGWAQYTRVARADLNCLKLPDTVDCLTGAALGCRYMTAFHAVMDQGRAKPGQWVAVFGCGGVGLSAVQIAASTESMVIAIDIDEQKLEFARKQGAVATVNAAQVGKVADAVREISGGGVHLSIDALGGSKTTLPALLSLRRKGRLVIAGLTSQEDKGYVSLPVDFMISPELEILGSLGCPHHRYAEIFSLIQRNKLNPKALITRQIGLDDITGVLEHMSQFKTLGLNVVTPF